MSRVGKNPVVVPSGVTVTLGADSISAKGPLGQLTMPLSPHVLVSQEGSNLSVRPASLEKEARMMWGTTRNLLANLVQGVHKGFVRDLEIEGVGYRASVQGKNLVLQLGFSHDVIFPIPEGVAIKCDKPTTVSITGIDKQKVGQVAAKIRSYRKPEPYKGKGVRYANEVILRKEGKKK